MSIKIKFYYEISLFNLNFYAKKVKFKKAEKTRFKEIMYDM